MQTYTINAHTHIHTYTRSPQSINQPTRTAIHVDIEKENATNQPCFDKTNLKTKLNQNKWYLKWCLGERNTENTSKVTIIIEKQNGNRNSQPKWK